MTATKGLTTFRGGDYVATLMADLDTKAISTRVAQIRERLGISQAELAKRVGVSKRSVEDWESPKKAVFPRRSNLNTLAALGGTTPDWILHGERPVTFDQVTRLESRIDDLVREIRGEFEAIRALLQAR